jgi:diguanylate cyclase (GGDEF)-like protein
VRVFDVCARIGGDEFAIIMPGATTAVGMQVAERIRREVETRTSGEPRITVSIGLAGLGVGATVEEFTNAADRALLAAKKGGRNRVCIATD